MSRLNRQTGVTEMETNDPRSAAVKSAIDRAGGVIAVATMLGLSRHAIYDFIKRGQIRADYCPTIEEWTGGKVRCEELNDRVNWAYLRAQTEPEASHV